jgi:hypothetical protein
MAAASERREALERMVTDGLLDEGDAYEVAETIELLAERVARGDISEHFALTVLEKLADDVRPKYLRRTWGELAGEEGKA